MTKRHSQQTMGRNATDFFTLNQKDYLIICDNLSKNLFLSEIP